MAKHTLRFLHCLHRKILKVCLTIFHCYTQKGWRSVHSIKLGCDIHFSHVIAQCTIITFQHIPLDTIQFFWNSWYLKKKDIQLEINKMKNMLNYSVSGCNILAIFPSKQFSKFHNTIKILSVPLTLTSSDPNPLWFSVSLFESHLV